MHIVMMLDQDRLAREQRMFGRLSVNLIEMGTTITQIVPETMLEDDAALQAAGPSQARIAAPMRVLPWMRRGRADRLADALERSEPELIFVSGRGAWKLAEDLSARLQTPMVIDVQSVDEVSAAPRGRSASHIGGFAAGTAALAERLRRRVDPGLVGVVPMGTQAPAHPRTILSSPYQCMSIAILCDGFNIRGTNAMLSALARIAVEYPQLRGFVVTGGWRDHDVWRAVKRARLGSRLSMLSDSPGQRPLFTQCDLMVIAEDLGEIRSLVLDAMAAGVPVVAAANPMLDMLEADQTARIVDPSVDTGWQQAIFDLLSRPNEARALGLAGRDCVMARHDAAEQAQKLLQTFEQVCRAGAIPFAESAR